MTREQFTARFPHASADTIRKNFPHDEALHVKLLKANELPAKKRLRQHQGDGLNKTERAFFEHLKAEFPNAEHFAQSFSFRLGNGATFRPDFVSVFVLQPRSDCGSEVIRVSAWETKGFKREASAVRLKVAAARFQFIKFHLVTKQRLSEGGGWSIEEVLP